MNLIWIDWLVIVVYMIFSLVIGLIYTRRAGKSVGEYFLAGRKLSWWLAGTSMVATTFAADTPLVVSGFVRKGGIWENWMWWSVLLGGMTCVFFYSRLWRRAKITTDVEFIEFRYGGKSAAILRGVLAVYGGVLANCIVMGWVMLAMAKIATTCLGWPTEIPVDLGPIHMVLSGKLVLLSILMIITTFYTVLSGLWGVVMTDLFQFILAMAGSIMLAWYSVSYLGGPQAMIEKIQATPGFKPSSLQFIPDIATAGKLAFFTVVVYLTIGWWGTGQGNGYIAQRLFACKDEKHSALAALWFNFAQYAIRSWPWILVGLASLAVFPLASGEDSEMAYPRMMVKLLPSGLLGMMVVTFLAAFMSTIETQLNWGASYLVNDVYRRFIRKDESPKHYVKASRYASLLMMVLAALTAWKMESITDAWKLLATLGVGAAIVGLLRWYWWRINAWSEISALLSSLVFANTLPHILPHINFPWLGCIPKDDLFAMTLLCITVLSGFVWIPITLLTTPRDHERLKTFYRRIRPGGWWGPIAKECPEIVPDRARRGWVGWLAGCVSIYAGMFGIGYLCIGQNKPGLALLGLCALSGYFMVTQASVGCQSEAQEPTTEKLHDAALEEVKS